MLSSPGQVPIYLCARPIDLRKSFDGLCGVIESALGRDVLQGHLFLFISKRQDRVKAIWWEPGGLVIWYKRLEKGTLELPKPDGSQTYVSLDSAQLAMLLAGVPLDQARTRRKRMNVA